MDRPPWTLECNRLDPVPGLLLYGNQLQLDWGPRMVLVHHMTQNDLQMLQNVLQMLGANKLHLPSASVKRNASFHITADCDTCYNVAEFMSVDFLYITSQLTSHDKYYMHTKAKLYTSMCDLVAECNDKSQL